MSASHADRNLLYGILAVQMNFVSKDALLRAMNAWVMEKHRPLGEILREQHALQSEHGQLLEALVLAHLAQHDNDPQKSLAAISSVDSARQALEAMNDRDIQASLASAPRLLRSSRGASDADPEATQAYSARPQDSRLRFRILRPLAKGGLGEVFVAEDSELHREVALKEIQDRHADDDSSRGRFVLEAEITGGLEHPGIVPIYGLGTYADGRPFYAMRLIKGDNLKTAIAAFHSRSRLPAGTKRSARLPAGTKRSARLPAGTKAAASDVDKSIGTAGPGRQPGPTFDSLEFRQLLGRFIDVCNAVAYAHSRGVLHRDLKPGNIMLGKFGETLVVDWGLAKVVGTTLTRSVSEGVSSTEPTLRPSSGSNAETHAGAAIGTPAFMSPEQAQGKLDELGPATDVYSLGATLLALLTNQPPVEGELVDVLAKVGRGEVRRPHDINPRIPKALAAICQKAMAFRAADRYGTPRDLAEDLERWLADEPVGAVSEPWHVRSRRFLRKHPQATAALAATILVGLVSLAATTAIVSSKNRDLLQANRAERAAHQEASQKQTEAESARVQERLAKDAAQESAADTRAFSDFLVNHVLAVARPEGVQGGLGVDVTVARAVESAESQLEETFAGRPLAEATARHAIGETWRNLGKYEGAQRHLQRALELRERLQSADATEILDTRNSLGVTFNQAGDSLRAIEWHEETLKLSRAKLGPEHPDTLTSMNNLAGAYRSAGKLELALPLYEETLKLTKAKLGPEHPDTFTSMNNLASAYKSAGKLDLALPLFEETLKLMRAKLGPEHPNTLTSMNSLAVAYHSAGKLELALPLFEETLKLKRAKLGPEHPNTLTSMNSLAVAYHSAEKLDLALPLYEETLKLMRAKLGPEHPDTLTSMNNLASEYKSAGKLDLALPLHEETLKLRRAKLGPEHPDTLTSMNNLALAYDSAGKLDLALPLHEETLKLRRAKLGPEHPNTLGSMNNLANAYESAGKLDLALPLYEETLKLRRAKLGPEHPDTLTSMNNLANAYKSAGKLDLALPLHEETLKLWRAKLGPEHPYTLGSMGNLASAHLQSRQFDQAIALFEAFVAGQRRRLATNEVGFAGLLASVSQDLVKHEQFGPAETYLRECLEIRRRKLPDDWSLFNTKSLLGTALAGQKKLAEAEPLLVEGFEGMKQRQDKIPAEAKSNLSEALPRLVALYTAWDKPAEAAKWQAELDAAQATPPKTNP